MEGRDLRKAGLKVTSPRLKVLEVREPEKRRTGTRVASAAELVERLRERGVI